MDELSDGCTGFQWAEWLFPVYNCCRDHDMGGSDGTLLDCLLNNTPQWAWPAVGLCITLMLLLRPLYRLVKSKGTAQH